VDHPGERPQPVRALIGDPTIGDLTPGIRDALLGPVDGPVFVDGFALRSSTVAHEALVGGDGRSAAVAAASIVAKVTRDRLMGALHERFPAWGFDQHVGYSSPGHRQAIAEHGVSELHRMSFASVAYEQLGLEV